MRINSAGHGIGTSIGEVIAETTDLYTFTFHELGMKPKFAGKT